MQRLLQEVSGHKTKHALKTDPLTAKLTGSASRHNEELLFRLIHCTAGRSPTRPPGSRSRCSSRRSTIGCRSQFRWFLRERSGMSRNWMSVRPCRSAWGALLALRGVDQKAVIPRAGDDEDDGVKRYL